MRSSNAQNYVCVQWNGMISLLTINNILYMGGAYHFIITINSLTTSVKQVQPSPVILWLQAKSFKTAQVRNPLFPWSHFHIYFPHLLTSNSPCFLTSWPPSNVQNIICPLPQDTMVLSAYGENSHVNTGSFEDWKRWRWKYRRWKYRENDRF